MAEKLVLSTEIPGDNEQLAVRIAELVQDEFQYIRVSFVTGLNRDKELATLINCYGPSKNRTLVWSLVFFIAGAQKLFHSLKAATI